MSDLLGRDISDRELRWILLDILRVYLVSKNPTLKHKLGLGGRGEKYKRFVSPREDPTYNYLLNDMGLVETRKDMPVRKEGDEQILSEMLDFIIGCEAGNW